eukprot:2575198-Alexandrium_andersonii.AAC.1
MHSTVPSPPFPLINDGSRPAAALAAIHVARVPLPLAETAVRHAVELLLSWLPGAYAFELGVPVHIHGLSVQ